MADSEGIRVSGGPLRDSVHSVPQLNATATKLLPRLATSTGKVDDIQTLIQ